MITSFDLGPISIQAFGLGVAIAFLCAGAVIYRRFDELGWDGEWAYEATGAALVGGLVGARLWWAVGDLDALTADPIAHLFTSSGLTWYGGVIGGALAVLVWGRWRGLDLWHLAGAAVPALALGYALGRIGCQISGDGDYGIASDLPWAMPYPDGVVPIDTPVHPTPIYETLIVGLVAVTLWHVRDRFSPERLVALYLVATGLERLVVELWRRNESVGIGLTAAQISALLVIAAGVGLWLAVRGTDAGGRLRT